MLPTFVIFRFPQLLKIIDFKGLFKGLLKDCGQAPDSPVPTNVALPGSSACLLGTE